MKFAYNNKVYVEVDVRYMFPNIYPVSSPYIQRLSRGYRYMLG